MAINKVVYGNNTLIDITDTTATESDVASGSVFYKANGVRSVGTASSGITSDTVFTIDKDEDGNTLSTPIIFSIVAKV